MPRRRSVFALLGGTLACATLIPVLAACAQLPEPTETIETFAAAADEAETPSAAIELSVERRPDPIVEELACTPYLLITARGTGEPSSGQLLSPVARSISESRPGQVQTLDLDYPADDNVNEGGTLGVRTLIDTLNVQARSCEDQRFVLLGYSQGALIIGDALSQPEHRLVGQTVGEIAEAAEERVIAIVLYGDPRFVAGEAHNAGDFRRTRSGILPRPAGTLEVFSERMRDYCAREDFVCQSNGFEIDPEGHLAYFDNGMQQDGAAFVIRLLGPLAQAQGSDEQAQGSDEQAQGSEDQTQNTEQPPPEN